jgi:WD40 repeat protein
LKGHDSIVYSVAFSPDGKTLATGSGKGTVKLWDVNTQQELATLKGPRPVHSVAFSPDGKTLATGSEDGTVKLWFAATEAEVSAQRNKL